MKLTKLQRYTLYCILLEEAEDIDFYDDYGFCHLIQDITGLYPRWNSVISENHVLFNDLCPELSRYRPPCFKWYWFNNWDERIKALKQCIEETHP